jgi:hypothetical protein
MCRIPTMLPLISKGAVHSVLQNHGADVISIMNKHACLMEHIVTFTLISIILNTLCAEFMYILGSLKILCAYSFCSVEPLIVNY